MFQNCRTLFANFTAAAAFWRIPKKSLPDSRSGKWVFGFVLVLGLTCALWMSLFVLSWLVVPSFSQVQEIAIGSDHVLLSDHGELLQTLRTDFKRRRLAWFGLNSFSDEIKSAVIEAEDQRFYSHFGFDPVGLGRAVTLDLKGHAVQGASTISMQLTDLIDPAVLIHNRTIRKGSFLHKLAQLGKAVLLEVRWDKQEILEAYLNLIHLKGELQGVPAFSYSYFDRHPLAIDGPEARVIAALISSPNQSRLALVKRACERSALAKPTAETASTAAASDSPIQSPACREIQSVVSGLFSRQPVMPQSPGSAPHLARRLFFENPKLTTLTSTVDQKLQLKVMEIMESNMQRLKGQNVHDNAAILIDNKSGRVLAYVGAVSTSESPHVDGVMASRQAGSSLKPFLYGRAIDQKLLTASSILMDDATAISWGGDVYRPANYDRHFNGAVSVREALASSLNVPAVKTATILGLKQTYAVLESLMLTGLKSADFYGVSMALGAVEVRLDELANAYRMMANGGLWSPLVFTQDPHASREDRDRADQAHLKNSKPLYTPEAAFIISSILSDPDARSIGFGWDNPLETSFWTAVKTGTSKDYRDNWCLGYSERYTVGVWAGNFDSQAMEKVSGVTGVGPTWAAIMNELHREVPSRQAPPPAGIVAKEVRHSWVSRPHREFYIRGTEPAHDVIEVSLNKRAQFVFPAEGSVLIKDPHMDQDRIALFVKFKGEIPDNSLLVMDKKVLGPAASPFRLENPSSGDHELTLIGPDHVSLTSIHFSIHGGN